MLGDDIGFPKMALPEICRLIDENHIKLKATLMYDRIEWVLEELKKMKAQKHGGGSFSIFHGSRNGFGFKAAFALKRHQYVCETNEWLSKEYPLSTGDSFVALRDGSGDVAMFNQLNYREKLVGPVSRAYFQAFCQAIKFPAEDPFSGGPPQLLGLGSSGMGRHYGLQTADGDFYQGSSADFSSVPAKTQWRNENFEQICANGICIKNSRRKSIKGKKRPPKEI